MSVTSKAAGQWDRRTPPSSISPEEAWRQGAVVPHWLRHYFEGRSGPPDYARVYYPDLDVPTHNRSPTKAVVLPARGRTVYQVRRVREVKHPAAQMALISLIDYMRGGAVE